MGALIYELLLQGREGIRRLHKPQLTLMACRTSCEAALHSLAWLASWGPFGWAFEPAFAFVKAKSQPKGPKATSAFIQKQLFS
jgi:hypothetical protein